MFILLINLVVAFVISSQAVPLDVGPRIVNGTDADIHDYPYMVSLQYQGIHICGGSIIDKYNILTAAHCVLSWNVTPFVVLPGSSDSTKGTRVPVEKVITHPSYKGRLPYSNDIAIVHLSYPLEFSDTIQPVQLPPSFHSIPSNYLANLTGWGYEVTDGFVQDILQKVEILVYEDEECEKSYPDGPTSRIHHVCAGMPEGGKGQCSGDSGGPLVFEGTQIGIVSWSRKPCTSEGNPGVFVKVSSYVDWILCNLKIL